MADGAMRSEGCRSTRLLSGAFSMAFLNNPSSIVNIQFRLIRVGIYFDVALKSYYPCLTMKILFDTFPSIFKSQPVSKKKGYGEDEF